MDAGIISYVLTGALCGCIGALVNIYFWYLLLAKKKIMGIDLHKGYVHSIQKILQEIPQHIDTSNIRTIEKKILDLFDEFMSEKLVKKMPVLAVFIDTLLISEIRTIFRNEMEVHLPQLLTNSITTEKNIFTIVKFAKKAILKGLKKYIPHAIMFLLISTLAGALIGGLIGWAM